MEAKALLSCSLCHSSIKGTIYKGEEEEAPFCCRGCLTVFQILKSQNALENFQDHPVYQQALKAGLITNEDLFSPKIEEQIPEEDFQKLHLAIENMWCPSCAQIIHLILIREKGIRKCNVDYSTDLATIEFTPRYISKEKILKIIQNLGYQPHFFSDLIPQKINRSLIIRFIIASFFALNVMMFAYPIYSSYLDGDDGQGFAYLFAYLSLFGSLPVIFYCGWPIWTRFYNGLKVGIWGMEALVTMGVVSATVLSIYELSVGSSHVYFDTIVVIILFVLLGKIIEGKAKFSAKDSLMKLSLVLPRRGRKRLEEGEECFVPIKEIKPGDLLIVKMGEKIILDGLVCEGTGSCDESVITGESIPVQKRKGEAVLAGSILIQGNLTVKVSSSFEQSTLSQIVEMVSEDLNHKSRYTRAADPIVKIFVPFVIGLALMTAVICIVFNIADENYTVYQTSLIRMISVLLISCPCAIGIAAPLVEANFINALSKSGILVRNRGVLSFLGRESVFIFDKTGTVTEGRFSLVEGFEGLSFNEKMILKGMTIASIHPISTALNQSLLVLPANLQNIEEISGRGMEAFFKNEQYRLGSYPFCKEIVPDLQEKEDFSESLFTTVYFVKENQLLAILELGDQIRPGLKELIQELSPAKTYLISGDSKRVVKQVAEACHFSHWEGEQLPKNKKEFIEKLRNKGEIVAFLGDGINDAPALTASHVGIAMVSASDISVQVSDLLMTSPRFSLLQFLREGAQKGRKIIKQNLFWAFFYNCIGLLLAIFGLLTPLFSAFAMVASSLVVLFNAQRMKIRDD